MEDASCSDQSVPEEQEASDQPCDCGRIPDTKCFRCGVKTCFECENGDVDKTLRLCYNCVSHRIFRRVNRVKILDHEDLVNRYFETRVKMKDFFKLRLRKAQQNPEIMNILKDLDDMLCELGYSSGWDTFLERAERGPLL